MIGVSLPFLSLLLISKSRSVMFIQDFSSTLDLLPSTLIRSLGLFLSLLPPPPPLSLSLLPPPSLSLSLSFPPLSLSLSLSLSLLFRSADHFIISFRGSRDILTYSLRRTNFLGPSSIEYLGHNYTGSLMYFFILMITQISLWTLILSGIRL